MWDLSVFLKVDFELSVPRGASAASRLDSPDAAAPPSQRYVGGQMRYFRENAPEQHADIVIDYNDLRQPKILKWIAAALSRGNLEQVLPLVP